MNLALFVAHYMETHSKLAKYCFAIRKRMGIHLHEGKTVQCQRCLHRHYYTSTYTSDRTGRSHTPVGQPQAYATYTIDWGMHGVRKHTQKSTRGSAAYKYGTSGPLRTPSIVLVPMRAHRL